MRSGVRVVCDLHLAAGQAATLLDELLRRGGVVVAGVPAQPFLEAALLAEHRGGPVGGGGAGVLEDRLGDLLAVDRAGEAGTDLVRAGGVPLLVVEGEGQGLDDAGGGVQIAVAEVVLDVLELGRGHVVDEVEVAGQQVGVGGVVVGVDLQGHAAVLRLVVAGVAVPLLQGHLGALGVGVDRVRPVSDRFLQPVRVVGEEGLGQRGVGGVAQGVGEGGELLLELDGEGPVVHDLEPGEDVGRLRAAGGVGRRVAVDVLEEVGVLLVVLQTRRVVPGGDEGFRRHFFAIAERPAVLDGDGEVLGVGGLDLLGQHVLGRAGLGVVLLQAAEDHVEDLAALHLVGVGGLQRVLRVSPGRAEHGAAVAAAVAPPAPARRRRECCRRRACGPLGVRGSTHGCLLIDRALPERSAVSTEALIHYG
ncbi:hypothetical protein QF030_005436 [Streptomyces rishiriensis]|uniref:Uncharacterized protein n=1 Tax=Streptomyces rishiriensis TaxID=68264 RepID=A0ABU0NWV9_STRRH|nr:hypothetical protein [Streptomyces rishiriensis]